LLIISETIRNGKRKGKAFSLFRAKGWKMRGGGGERERERERERNGFAVWCSALLLLNCISGPWLSIDWVQKSNHG